MAVLALGAAGCGSAVDASPTRTVRVDYNHDEFPGSFIAYFPSNVQVHPGDAVVFRQDWTGEAHSVTMGTLVDQAMPVVAPLMDKYPEPDAQPSPEDEAAFEDAMKDLPWMVADGFLVQQNGAQPCFLEEGTPPKDPGTPCDREHQRQPAFNGRQSYYNSGFIPYAGPRGNRFEVRLATDIAPGRYSYYCNLHGPAMRGTITVVPADVDIPSEEEVARQTRREIDAEVALLSVSHREAHNSDPLERKGKRYQRPLAGWAGTGTVRGFHSEFFPDPIQTRVGEKVTWTFVGPHTVSFDVPPYFAQFTISPDGTVVANPDAVNPVNSPPLPKDDPTADGGGKTSSPPPPKPPPVIDGGEWDGTTFKSSGLLYEGQYSLTFTKPGTYPYACLVHPRMVGKVVVR